MAFNYTDRIKIKTWSINSIFEENQPIIYDDILYVCIENHTSTTIFDETKFQPTNSNSPSLNLLYYKEPETAPNFPPVIFGNNSIAIGNLTEALGNNCFVFGSESSASTDKSISLGFQINTGNMGVGIGNYVSNLGERSIGIGSNIFDGQDFNESILIGTNLNIAPNNTDTLNSSLSKSILIGKNIDFQNMFYDSGYSYYGSYNKFSSIIIGRDTAIFDLNNTIDSDFVFIGNGIASNGDNGSFACNSICVGNIINTGPSDILFGKNLNSITKSPSILIGQNIISSTNAGPGDTNVLIGININSTLPNSKHISGFNRLKKLPRQNYNSLVSEEWFFTNHINALSANIFNTSINPAPGSRYFISKICYLPIRLSSNISTHPQLNITLHGGDGFSLLEFPILTTINISNMDTFDPIHINRGATTDTLRVQVETPGDVLSGSPKIFEFLIGIKILYIEI